MGSLLGDKRGLGGDPRGKEARPLSVSALVCTRDRPGELRRAIASVLRTEFSRFELLVVDSSRGPHTQRIVERFRSLDKRIRYLRSNRTGLSAARNLAIAKVSAELVVFTDDDCVVKRGWLGAMVRAFEADEEAGLAWGEVIPARDVSSDGFIVGCHIEQYRGVKGKSRSRRFRFTARPSGGIGANMAVRRKVVIGLGGFDPALGPGGQFFACVDGDMTVRCLLEGYHVYESKESYVYHHGIRDWEEERSSMRRAWFGIGAAYVKPLKCGRWGALPVLLYEFLQGAVLPFLWATLTFRRPKGWLRVNSFLRGALQGWRTPVDRQNILFRFDSEDNDGYARLHD